MDDQDESRAATKVCQKSQQQFESKEEEEENKKEKEERGKHLRYTMRRNFMSTRVQGLHLAVIGPFVRHIKSADQRTSVRILAARVEYLFVQFPIQIVDRVVEREQHQLRRFFVSQVSCEIEPKVNRKISSILCCLLKFVILNKRNEDGDTTEGWHSC